AARVEAVRALLGEGNEGARLDEAGAQALVFLGRPVAPVHTARPEYGGPLVDPVDQLAIGGRRSALVRDRARHGDASPSGRSGGRRRYRDEMFRGGDGRRS